MSKHRNLLLIALVFSVNLFLAYSIGYPERVNAKGFPNQNQSIYGGWIVSNTTTQSLLYYNLFSKDGTDVNATQGQDTSIPLVLFLEGGPGSSAVATAFAEIGPYLATVDQATQQGSLAANPNSWTRKYHLLVIDSPVGVGFSVRKNNDVVTSTDQATTNLITFFLRFFQKYPGLKSNPFYIDGRSFGGKFATLLAEKMLNSDQFDDINFAGVILTNALIDPMTQMRRARNYYNFGIINQQQKNFLLKEEAKVKCLFDQGKLAKATQRFFGINEYLSQATGGVYQFNFLSFVNPQLTVPQQYLNLALSQLFFTLPVSPYRQIFSLPTTFNFSSGSSDLGQAFATSGDYAVSVVNSLENILAGGVDVLILSGQLDAVLPSSGILNYVNDLEWFGNKGFKAADWEFIKDDADNVLVSYQKYDNLNYGVVNKAGHVSSYDQPQSVWAVIDGFINKQL